MDGLFLVLFCFAAFAGGFVSGFSGFAMGLVVSSVWLHIITPIQTAALIAGYGLLTQGYGILKLRQKLNWGAIWPLSLGTTIGIPIGVILLTYINPVYMRLGVGVLLVFYAIYSLARLKKDDKEITELIAGYMTEPRFPIRVASINALGWRGDKSAIPALEAMLKSDDLSIEVVPMIKRQIGRLRGGGTKNGTHAGGTEETSTGGASEGNKPEVADRLERLEKLVHEMNERLKSIELKLSAK